MASLQATADSIRAAVSSTSTCTPATATILSDLLLPKSNIQTTTAHGNSKKSTKSVAPSKQKASKVASGKPRGRKIVEQENAQQHEDQLSPKERSVLATEVINATLKALSEAIKAPEQGPVWRQASSKDLIKASARKTLRRSNSLPQSPLQPRSLNRVSSSPSISTRQSRSSSSASTTSFGHRSTGECARVAFACLRTLQTSKLGGVDLPPLQLENGMSVLIGKLISLGLDDLAIKEVRILKKRLHPENVSKKGSRPTAATSNTPQTLCELLDFGKGIFSGAILGLVITTQLHILRLMAPPRKYSQIEALLPVLRPEYPSSPTRLLLLAAKEPKDLKQREKVARQLQTLSETLLSLCPSVSLADDALALESRLSATPEVAFQLQTLALQNRVHWWKLAGHKGDSSKDLYDPFLRCLSTFARRNQCGSLDTYKMSSSAFTDLELVLSAFTDAKHPGPTAPVSGIYRLLSSLSKEANLVDEAISWAQKFEALLDPNVDSDAKRCTVAARLVGLNLRRPSRHAKEEELVLRLLDGLERPFKGESSEIDDLLTEISFSRRSANSFLAKRKAAPPNDELSGGLDQMCESLIFLCPRLSLRYLGNPPTANSTTKDILRHEQRRTFITASALHSIDSVLFLVKTLREEDRLDWDLMDSKLQDCLLLLDRLDISHRETTLEGGALPPAYHVKISNMYYTQFLNMRRDSENSKDGQQIRALRRSIDCIRARPQTEKKAAFISTKLERMAELCKSTGRFDELFKTLSSLRDEMVENGVLSAVVTTAASQPVQAAWFQDDSTSTLGRTVQSLLKVQMKYLNTSGQLSLVDASWSEEERGVVLEHQLEMLCNQSTTSIAAADYLPKIFKDLLSIYGNQKYPIRRFRVLVRLLRLDLDPGLEFIDNLEGELKPYSSGKIVVEGTKDDGLRDYLTHFKIMAMMVMELQQELPDVDTLKQGLSAWSSIREQCEDLATLERQIEDIPGLVAHLKSIADYFQMKGVDSLRVTVLRLIADFNQLIDCSGPDDIILSFTKLGAQWLQLGYSGKAGLALDKARSFSHQNGVSSHVSLQLHISYAEYLLAIGNYDKCEEHLATAQTLYSQGIESSTGTKKSSTLEYRTRQNGLISNAHIVYSMLALERGLPQMALAHAKHSVRLLRRAWTNIEGQIRSQSTSPDTSAEEETNKPAEEVSQMSITTITIPANNVSRQSHGGSSFWYLVTPLFRGLNYLSGLYAHHGMFQETIYYAEQAHKLAKGVNSEAHITMATVLLGSTWLKGGKLDKGSEYLMEAKRISAPGLKIRDAAILTYHRGHMHGLLGDNDAEVAAYEEAEQVLDSLIKVDCIEAMDKFVNRSEGLEEKMSQLTISKRKAPVTRKVASRAKAPEKRKATTRAKSPVEITSSVAEECHQLVSLRATVVRQKARALMLMKKYMDALGLLKETDDYATPQIEAVDQGVAMAKLLLLQSIEQMNADPVYSVLQDSTISFPSVTGLSNGDKHGERLSTARQTPPKRSQVAKNGRDRTRSKSPAPDGFFDKLRRAQEHLTEVQSVAIAVAPIAVIHRISALLNSIAILLSASGQAKSKPLVQAGFASCSVETARTLAIRRQRKANQADSETAVQLDVLCWPALHSSDSRRSSLGFQNDMSRFQRDYIDIIPKSWTAISISLSDSRQELSITKLQAGHGPFVLRLPLGRHNSIDADEEVFDFEQGHSELLDIIDLSNESAHDAVGMTGRDAKIAWWEEREALDARLRDLLENIEKVWLGGFTGIFSQHARRPDLLARFQKSFQNILDKHLPSRQKNRKKTASPRVTLDPRILELFIGLGDASNEDCDFSEPLTDLLYFVVDVLQFHGELNAYAEIDFDSIVVETHDALRGYHSAVKASSHGVEGRHTILILDTALHAFPWESLPCMDGLAVSRLPSLGCLRERIIDQQDKVLEDGPEGCYIDRDNGSYILNPSGDLKNTQATFQKRLQSLNEWDGIIKREPTENEIKACLESKDLYLYFGHGSGAQYIRAREIRKLGKCAVTWLMGCSSGALVEAGEFEPYGPPINYMHTGCPALVATLWDVTDKDIDRFAKTTFEHWGLFEGETVGKGKGKKRTETPQAAEKMSLVEAVAKGREACNLRYLNAAAVCVYGIPVYFR